MLNNIIDMFRRLGLNGPKISRVTYTNSSATVPESVRRWEMWVVGTPDLPKWAVIDCPCGLGHTIKVSLNKNHSPHWDLIIGTRGPSLDPSIDLKEKPFCHFWVKNGYVKWVYKGRRF